VLLRRGPRIPPPSSYPLAPPQREEPQAPQAVRSAARIYSGGTAGVYPRGGSARKSRLLEVLGDGEFHHASELRRKVDSPVELVSELGELLDSGYVVVRSLSHLKLRRRGDLEARQDLATLIDGLDLDESVESRALPAVATRDDEISEDELDFNVGDDAGEVSAGGGLVLSDPPEVLMLPSDGSASMTGAILARKGSGKSYLGMVLVEELLGLDGVTVVVFDPTGVWWGLLSTAGGEPSAYGAILLGGPRGHEKIASGSGAGIAEVVNAVRPRPVVVDLSELAPSEQHEVVASFCERLVGLPHFPIHVVIDEADEFAPQRLGAISKHQKRALGHVERMVMRGRSRGIGVTLISLRPAVISKNVLSQVDALWLLQMAAPQDLRAVEDWLTHFDHKVSESQRVSCLSQLPMLPVGTAYFLRGGERAAFRRFKVRHKSTYDSSKTLVVGASDNPILSEIPAPVRDIVRELLLKSLADQSSEDQSG